MNKELPRPEVEQALYDIGKATEDLSYVEIIAVLKMAEMALIQVPMK